MAAILGTGAVINNDNQNVNTNTNNIVLQLPPSETDNFDDVVTSDYFPFIGKSEWVYTGSPDSPRFPLMIIERDNLTKKVTVEIFDRCTEPQCSLSKRPAQYAYDVLTSTMVLEDGTTYFVRAKFVAGSTDLKVMIKTIEPSTGLAGFETNSFMKRVSEA